MKVEINNKNKGIIIVNISGKFDIETLNNFETGTDKILREDIHTILINFKKLEYIDSSGIGELIKLMNMSKRKNIKLP